MFLRFVTDRIDPDSGRRQGLFQAAYDLAEGSTAAAYDRDRVWEAIGWFRVNLEEPVRLALSRRPHAPGQAVCWFKSAAAEHVARAHQLAGVLRENGVSVEVLRTRRPGYIVAEDAFQVAAYPFADTPA